MPDERKFTQNQSLTRVVLSEKDARRLVSHLMTRRLWVPCTFEFMPGSPNQYIVGLPEIVDLTDLRKRLKGINFTLASRLPAPV